MESLATLKACPKERRLRQMLSKEIKIISTGKTRDKKEN